MKRFFTAVAAIVACLALAAPAMAEPAAEVITTCENNQTMFRVNATGFPAGESYGVYVADASGEGQLSATAGDTTTAEGTFSSGFGADIESGTYTVYAYTGPYQTVAEGDNWPGAIYSPEFDPSLTTAFVSTTVQVACGPPSKEECKMGGFEDLGYTNQGRCVSARAPGRV
jgi:hypothetical protein